MAKLKVFRTAIGFHDAYVAAPSMKAALEAWGSGSNLFAQGLAETVDDPKLTKAPLAKPGEVIKVKRGSAADHFAALDKFPEHSRDEANGKAKAGPIPRAAKPAKPTKPKPRPSRAKLDAARAALADLQARHKKATDALAKKEAALRDERRRLESSQDAEAAKLQRGLEQAETGYEAAMAKWRTE